MIQNLLYVLILLAGFPTGYFLAKLCSDEIKKWKGRLTAIMVASFIIAIGISFTTFEYKIPIIITLFFTIIVCLKINWMGSK
jgi:hypothetical protein